MHNVATLEELSELHLYDFGIFIELAPDEEEKQMLENNIQQALAQKIIALSDAIDIRGTKNIKLANQLLKIKEKKKKQLEQQAQQQNIQAQAQANAKSQQVAAQAEVQKQQSLIDMQIKLEQAKAEFKAKQLEQEVAAKERLMDKEFQINQQLQGMKLKADAEGTMFKEGRKDAREDKKFESSGNDIVSGRVNMEGFEPR